MEKLMKTLAILSNVYDYFPEERARVYLAFLKDLPEEAVCKTIGELVRTEEKCPSIAKIRKETERLLMAAQGKSPTDVGEKWTKFLATCKRVDYFKRVVHFPDDPVMERVARMFPVDEILSTPDGKMAIVRKQFIDRYRETEQIYNKNEGYKVLISKIHNAKEIGCPNKRIGYAISQIGKMEGKK